MPNPKTIKLPKSVDIVAEATKNGTFDEYKRKTDRDFKMLWNGMSDIFYKHSSEDINTLKNEVLKACFGANLYKEKGNIYDKQRNKKEEFEKACQKQIEDLKKIQQILNQLKHFESYGFLNSSKIFRQKQNILENLNNYKHALAQAKERNALTLNEEDYIDANRIIGNLYYPHDIHKKHRKVLASTCLAFHLAIIFRLWTSGRLSSTSLILKPMPRLGKPMYSTIAKILNIAFISPELYSTGHKEYTEQTVKDALSKLRRVKLIPWMEYL